jgi:hypothetical protein
VKSGGGVVILSFEVEVEFFLKERYNGVRLVCAKIRAEEESVVKSCLRYSKVYYCVDESGLI